jgi:hypothetical protein
MIPLVSDAGMGARSASPQHPCESTGRAAFFRLTSLTSLFLCLLLAACATPRVARQFVCDRDDDLFELIYVDDVLFAQPQAVGYCDASGRGHLGPRPAGCDEDQNRGECS